MSPPIDIEKEDEVWLALTVAKTTLLAEGHSPRPEPLDGKVCTACLSLWFLENGMRAYLARNNK